jgi:hypothetical protein
MKRIFYFLIPLLLISACTDNKGSSAKLEKSVVERAMKEPESSKDFFMEKIEAGASLEEQAIYMYGIAIAREKEGDITEAINDYLVAEGLGNKSAVVALDRLKVKRDQ